MPVVRNDPFTGFNFVVSISGVLDEGGAVHAAFSEASGLEIVVTPIEYRNGAEDITVRKLPGLKKFTNIVLKRGVTGDLTLWRWIKSVLDGKAIRADGTITLLDESRSPVLSWRFRRGWPCRLTGPTLKATANEIAIETLEICHEGLELVE